MAEYARGPTRCRPFPLRIQHMSFPANLQDLLCRWWRLPLKPIRLLQCSGVVLWTSAHMLVTFLTCVCCSVGRALQLPGMGLEMEADQLQLCPAGHWAQLAHGPEAGSDCEQVLCGQHC